MTYLENVSATEPWNALNEVDDIHLMKRLMIAIAYKQAITQTDVAEWYGLSQKTIYNWLQRFEEEPVRNAAQAKASPVAH